MSASASVACAHCRTAQRDRLHTCTLARQCRPPTAAWGGLDRHRRQAMHQARNRCKRSRAGWATAATTVHDRPPADLLALSLADWYLLKELVPTLCLAVLALGGFSLSIAVGTDIATAFASSNAVSTPMWASAAAALLKAPHHLALAMPIASLLAPLLALGRLRVTGELAALGACGAGPLRLLQPLVLVYLVLAAVNYVVAVTVAPAALSRATAMVSPRPRPAASPLVYFQFDRPAGAADHATCARPPPGRLVAVLHAVGSRRLGPGHLAVELINPTLVELPRVPAGATTSPAAVCPTRVITASTARPLGIHPGGWLFLDGATYTQASTKPGSRPHAGADHGVCDVMDVATFDRLITPGVPHAPAALDNRSRCATTAPDFDALSGADLAARVSHHCAARDVIPGRRLEVKAAQRAALPGATAIFGPLGALCALGGGGTPASRRFGGPAAAAAAVALAVCCGHYALAVAGAAAAQAGRITPLLGAWLPNAAGAASLVIALVVVARSRHALRRV